MRYRLVAMVMFKQIYLAKCINRAYAGLRHAIVIATKPHFRVTSSLSNKARLGGDNNSVT